MAESSRLTVLIKDYELIRAEAMYRLQARQQITTFFVPVIGSLIAAGYKAGGKTSAAVFAFAVPGLCYETIYLWLSETQALRRASHYLSGIAQAIQEEVAFLDPRYHRNSVLTWESELRRKVQAPRRSHFYGSHYIFNTLLFWIPALTSEIIGVYQFWVYRAHLGGFIALTEIAGLLIAAFTFAKKTRQILQLYDAKSPNLPDTI